MSDPTMPAQMPDEVKAAIARIKSFKSWEPVEMYAAVYEALQGARTYGVPEDFKGSGKAPNQGGSDGF